MISLVAQADVAVKLVEHGTLGLVAFIALLGLGVLYRDNKAQDAKLDALNAQRVADQQAQNLKQLEIITRCVETIAKNSHVGEEQTDAFRELKSMLERLGEDLRRRLGGGR